MIGPPSTSVVRLPRTRGAQARPSFGRPKPCTSRTTSTRFGPRSPLPVSGDPPSARWPTNLGTGLAAGFDARRRPLARGCAAVAGEIGHIPVRSSGRACARLRGSAALPGDLRSPKARPSRACWPEGSQGLPASGPLSTPPSAVTDAPTTVAADSWTYISLAGGAILVASLVDVDCPVVIGGA